MFAFLNNLTFAYHPWSLMYVIAFVLVSVLLLIIKSEWYINFINRNDHLPNAKYGKLFYNKLVFACKVTLVLAIFCFFMTNVNQQNSALILSASCGKQKSPRVGKLYIEDVSNECKDMSNEDCFKQVLINSKKAKDENLKAIKMVWPFKISIKGVEQDFNAEKICKKVNLQKIMMNEVSYNKSLFGFVTKMQIID